jgi:glutamyl-tRNA reductase
MCQRKLRKKSPPEALEVVVLGLSHHTSSVDIRERLSIPEEFWNDASGALCDYGSINEAAVLSTCNRFEIYLAGKNPYECMRDAIDYLHKRSGGALDVATLRKNLFLLTGEDAAWHLLRVSAGLDSLVVGEGQILSQVKKAHEHGTHVEKGQAGKVVSRMLNSAITAGKRARTETGISRGAVSVSSAAAEFTVTKLLEDCNVPSITAARITIIGAGKMARLLLTHLRSQGVSAVTVVNKRLESIEVLQSEFPDMQIEMRLLDQLYETVGLSDVVFPCTASTTTIIEPVQLAATLEARDPHSHKGGVMFVDISVPRNVHADCSEVPGAACYNVDHLKAVVQRNTSKRKKEMQDAELILKEELGKFRHWQQSLGAIPTITRLQEKAGELCQDQTDSQQPH